MIASSARCNDLVVIIAQNKIDLFFGAVFYDPKEEDQLAYIRSCESRCSTVVSVLIVADGKEFEH
jgi:hypothetical protein